MNSIKALSTTFNASTAPAIVVTLIVEILFKLDATAVDSKVPPLAVSGTIENDCDE